MATQQLFIPAPEGWRLGICEDEVDPDGYHGPRFSIYPLLGWVREYEWTLLPVVEGNPNDRGSFTGVATVVRPRHDRVEWIIRAGEDPHRLTQNAYQWLLEKQRLAPEFVIGDDPAHERKLIEIAEKLALQQRVLAYLVECTTDQTTQQIAQAVGSGSGSTPQLRNALQRLQFEGKVERIGRTKDTMYRVRAT